MAIKLNGSTSGSVALDAPADTSPSGTDVTLTLPTSAGSSGQVLTTNGSGTLSWGPNVPDAIDVDASAPADSVNIDGSGRLLVGTDTARANFFNSTGTGLFQVEGTSGGTNRATMSLTNNSTGNDGAWFVINKSNGNADGSNNLVSSGNTLGSIGFQGSDGSEFVFGAIITAEVDGNPGANDMPGRLVFSTTADGASSPTERMRLNNAGRCYIPGVYNFTSGTSANVVVDTDGQLRRATSSKKYKTDIETLENSYADALLECRPVWYRSTADDSVKNPHYSYYGFIAEEVAEIDPRLVFWKTNEISYDENGNVVSTSCEPEPEGVQYDRFVPHLLNLIKRQKQQLETQAATIAAFEARLTALEGGAA